MRRSRRGRRFAQAAGLAIAAPFLFTAAWTPWLRLVVVSLAAFGFGRGVYEANCMPVLCQIARPELRATGYGIFNMAGCVVGGVMAVAAGAGKDSFGLGVMFQLAAAVLLVSAVALVRLKLPARAAGESPAGLPTAFAR